MHRRSPTLLLIAALLTACSLPESEQAAAPEPVQEVAEEAEQAEQEVTLPSPEPEPSPSPEPEPVEDSGDYDSTDDYVEEVIDTSDKVASLLETMAEVANSVGDGSITFEEGAELGDNAARITRTHIDFFESRTAPDQFSTVEGHMLDALHYYEESFGLFARCLRTEDFDLCDDAAALMDDGRVAMDRATAAVPTS